MLRAKNSMDKDIVLIPGALASPKFWHHQENYFQKKARLHYIDVSNGFSIKEIAERFIKTAPNKFTLIAILNGWLCRSRVIPLYSS